MTPEPWVAPTVLFTFDDVSDNIHANAFPVLTAAGLAATVYVVSGIVGTSAYATLSHLQELYAAGWDVGNHTATHVHLDTLDAAAQQAELETCSAYLVANDMPRAALHAAYPYGDFNADTFTAMSAAGMHTGRTTSQAPERAPTIDPYEIDGVANIGAGTLVADVKATIDASVAGTIINLVGHNVTDVPDAGIPIADFTEIVAYVKARGCRVVTISQLWDYIQAGYVWP